MDPFYDPTLTYEQNYARGPFGALARPAAHREHLPTRGHQFLSLSVNQPFGIPAGPLLNARFVSAAFGHGFDICAYKTVRTRAHPSNPFPNVLAVHVDGDLTLERAEHPLLADSAFNAPLSISNSFGVPSQGPDVWQPDMADAVRSAGAGQLLVGSFQGTRSDGGSIDAFVADHVKAAQLVVETGAPVLELNLSCPNEGVADLLCFDTERVRRIVGAIKDEIGNTPLLLKLAHFGDIERLRLFVSATVEFAAGFAAVNTIPAALVNASGAPALPGEGRSVSGVCGAAIRWAGLEMTHWLRSIRDENSADFAIVGVGGVLTADDYAAYRSAGADAVLSATGAMWNPDLAHDIARSRLHVR